MNGLNPAQQEVVACDGHCLAVACPGSGKTTTLAAKVVRLLNEGKRVAAVTFTREAALELRARISKLTPRAAWPRLVAGTFHSMCLFMAHPEKAGSLYGKEIFKGMKTPFDRPWKVVEAGCRDILITVALRETGSKLDVKTATLEIEAVKAGLATGDHARDLTDIYQNEMARRGWVDFQDMILLVNDAIKRGTLPALAVDSLLVDEFQDTDALQYEWMRLNAAGITKPIVTAVGDDDQSIFAFRRALGFSVMKRFLSDFHAKEIVLGTNYRSKSEITSVAQTLIEHNRDRLGKTLVSRKGSGGTVSAFSFETVYDESAKAAAFAFDAFTKGKSAAIIVRTKRRFADIERALIKLQAPCRTSDSSTLLERPEVAAFFRLVHFLVEPTIQDLTLFLMWAGFPREDRDMIAREYCLTPDGELMSPDIEDLSPRSKRLWLEFRRRLSIWRVMMGVRRNFVLFAALTGWMKECAPKRYTTEIIDVASRLMHPKSKNLKEHLEQLKILFKHAGEKKESCVDVMTAHAAKGLEFDCVWIAGACDGVFPDAKTPRDEERRLMYVAMTRARDDLRVSHTRQRTASCFLAEAGLTVKDAGEVLDGA